MDFSAENILVIFMSTIICFFICRTNPLFFFILAACCSQAKVKCSSLPDIDLVMG